MTTKPKARRFRLRLGDDAAAALRTSVSPQAREGSVPPPGAARVAVGTGGQAAGRPAAAAPQPASGATATSTPTAPSRPAPAVAPDRSVPIRPAAPANQTPPPDAPRAPAQDHSADVGGSPRADAEIDAIRDEGLTGRQLRMAMRVAQRNGIKATTGIDAVRMLREKGIDPFERSTLLDIVRDETERSRALTTTEAPPLPRTHRQPANPLARIEPVQVPAAATAPAAQRQIEIGRIQKDIARRRRRRMALLASRLAVFVLLPTLMVAWYFFVVATPLYATKSEFVIQQADSAATASAGGLGGMFAGSPLGGNQDSVTVQSFLMSRDAMRRLDSTEGFKAYFQQDTLDPLLRLPADATDEAAYRLYEDMVRVSYDPTEGIIRMEVIAADPATSERFARALVGFAEEQVDQLTQRLRENQMRDAMESVSMAEARFSDAQLRVLELQERFQMLSSEVEVSLLTQQIANLETQLNNERLGLSDLRANARPNAARLEQTERRIAALESQIAGLRGSLTQGGEGGQSVARLQREQVMAESDVATRQMLLAQAMQNLEVARTEANRQVRYLSLGVSPVAPDEATYPRAFSNTALAFLIFAGIYLMVSMTSAILREQVTG